MRVRTLTTRDRQTGVVYLAKTLKVRRLLVEALTACGR
jgi:hypothetical protein